MTAPPTFGTYTEPETGDQFKPAENYNVPLLVKVRQRKEGIVTTNTPEGGPGVICDVVNLTTNEVLRSVLWMGGAIVDGLTPFANGAPLVIRFEPRKSNSGRTYPSPVNAAEWHPHAAAYYQQHGDPFAPQFGSVTPAVPAVPPPPPVPAPPAVPVPAQATLPASPLGPPAAIPVPGAAPTATASQIAAMQNAGLDTSAFTVVPG